MYMAKGTTPCCLKGRENVEQVPILFPFMLVILVNYWKTAVLPKSWALRSDACHCVEGLFKNLSKIHMWVIHRFPIRLLIPGPNHTNVMLHQGNLENLSACHLTPLSLPLLSLASLAKKERRESEQQWWRDENLCLWVLFLLPSKASQFSTEVCWSPFAPLLPMPRKKLLY